MRAFTWKKSVLLLLALMMIMTVPDLSCFADAAPSGTETAQQEEKNGLVKEGGKFFFYRNGKKTVSKWVTIKKNTYYFGEDGTAVTGWKTLKKGSKYKVFYFTKKGVLKPKKTSYIDQKSVNKIVKKADQIIRKAGVTKTTDAETALEKLYRYMTAGNHFKYSRDTSVSKPKGWEYPYAAAMLGKRAGSCYHFAAAYAFLAARATGLPVKVCTGKAAVFDAGLLQPHAWTEVKIGGKWYIVDTDAGKFSKRKNIPFFKLKVSSATAKKNFKKAKKTVLHF